MKWFFAAVLVLNLAAGGWIALSKPPVADFSAREVSPQQVKLLPAGLPASAPVADPTATLVEASAPLAVQPASAPAAQTLVAKAAAPAKAAAQVPAAKPAALACYRWGALDDAQLSRVKRELAPLRLKASQMAEQREEAPAADGKRWVYYPPLATQAETQTLIAELKGKGFDSYIVRTAGPRQGYLSLGLFGKASAAEALVARLKAAGYPNAGVDVRGKATQRVRLDFVRLESWQADKLRAAQQRLLPGVALQGVPCR